MGAPLVLKYLCLLVKDNYLNKVTVIISIPISTSLWRGWSCHILLWWWPCDYFQTLTFTFVEVGPGALVSTSHYVRLLRNVGWVPISSVTAYHHLLIQVSSQWVWVSVCFSACLAWCGCWNYIITIKHCS